MTEISLKMLCALAGLRDRDREIIIDVYFLGHTQAEIADRLGVARQVVSLGHRRGLDQLATLLADTPELAA